MSAPSARDYATCRLCKKHEETYRHGRPNLFKYGVRHYAHAACGLAKWGADFFGMLPDHVLRQFPAPVAWNAGLLAELERRVVR